MRGSRAKALRKVGYPFPNPGRKNGGATKSEVYTQYRIEESPEGQEDEDTPVLPDGEPMVPDDEEE